MDQPGLPRPVARAGHTPGGSRRALALGTIGIVLGFAAIFVLTKALLGGLGGLLLQHQRLITVTVGLFIIILGRVSSAGCPCHLHSNSQ